MLKQIITRLLRYLVRQKVIIKDNDSEFQLEILTEDTDVPPRFGAAKHAAHSANDPSVGKIKYHIRGFLFGLIFMFCAAILGVKSSSYLLASCLSGYIFWTSTGPIFFQFLMFHLDNEKDKKLIETVKAKAALAEPKCHYRVLE